MTRATTSLLLLLVLFCGCRAGTQEKQTRHNDQILQAPPPTRAEAVPAVPAVPAVTPAKIEELRSEFQSSNNVTKNEIQGLGVQITRVAEKVQGFGGDLLRLENSLNVAVENTANIKAEVNQKVQTEADLRATAIANLEARITANLEQRVQAQVQAGFANRSESNQTTVKAGGDSSITQFTSQMQAVFERSFSTTVYVVAFMSVLNFLSCLCLCAMIVVLVEASRRRAEERHREAKNGGKS